MMWSLNDMCSDTSSSDSDILPGFFPIYCNFRGTMAERKVYQAYKGQLKLSVYINYGLLTVHVMQARNLQCHALKLCDTYIKLRLDPDTTNRTCCTTEVVLDSNNPLFDEKFSFELLEEDVCKRLQISIWNRDKNLSEDEFLGSMSFGIQHIQQHGQIVAGWYYLLMGDVGLKKHLRVTERKLPSSGAGIPSVNTDIKWMEAYTFVLKRKRGFGFSLCGSCPVSVSKVEPGSTAAVAGLHKGDCIVKVDGVNVSRSTADSIARIFRHADKQVTLEVHRPQHQGAPYDSEKVGWRPPLSDNEPNCEPQKIEKLNVSPWKPPNVRSLGMETDEMMQNYGWLESADRTRIQSRGQRTDPTHVHAHGQRIALVSVCGQRNALENVQCQQSRTHSVQHQQCQQNGPLSMQCQQNGPLSMQYQQNGPLSMQCQQNGPLSMQCQQNGPLSMQCQQNGPLSMQCQQSRILSTHCQPNAQSNVHCQQNKLVYTDHQQYGTLRMQRQHTEPFSIPCQQSECYGTNRQRNELLGSNLLQTELFDTDCQQNGLIDMECQQNELIDMECQQYDVIKTQRQQTDHCLPQWHHTGSLSRTKLTTRRGRTLLCASSHRDPSTPKTWYSHGKENHAASTLPSGAMRHRKVSFKDF